MRRITTIITHPSACLRGASGKVTPTLPVDNLPDPPYVLSSSSRFAVEEYGTVKKQWLANLPRYKEVLRNSVYVPSKERLWSSSIPDSLHEFARCRPYHDVLRIIMEHGFFFLLNDLISLRDGPLPHVMYEDFMKCLTFASLQNPPEEQFSLSPEILRGLLCLAAYHCVVDPAYFGTCEVFFRKMEQQQTVGREVLSSWIFCCAAAGNVSAALSHARVMSNNNMEFDEVVFSLLMHPSVSPISHADPNLMLDHAKGMLLQRRLGMRMGTVYRADSIVAHALFVFYSLTLNHVRKWEALRLSVESGVVLMERTVSFVIDVFAKEKGYRCGPRTSAALAISLSATGSAAQLLFVLMRVRRNESLPQLAHLSHMEFSEAELLTVASNVHLRARSDRAFQVAASLVIPLLFLPERHPQKQVEQSAPFQLLSSAAKGRDDTDGDIFRSELRLRQAKLHHVDCTTKMLNPVDESKVHCHMPETCTGACRSESLAGDAGISRGEKSHFSAPPSPLSLQSLEATSHELLTEIKLLDHIHTTAAAGRGEACSMPPAGATAQNVVKVIPGAHRLEGDSIVHLVESEMGKMDGLRHVVWQKEREDAADVDILRRLRSAWISPEGI